MSVSVDSSALEDSAAVVQRLQNPAGDTTLPPPPPPISPRALEVIKTLDSRSFGFLDFQQSSSGSGSTNIITKDFIRQGIAKLQEDLTSGPQTDTFRGEVFCHLGHLHLLLEEYKEALSAYQHYQRWCPESGTHTPLLYGLGLIFYHINAHKWATEAFQRVLQLAPNFARSNEIYLHLGVMCKMKGETTASLQHFQKALSIPGPSSLSKFEIQFHIGYLYYMEGQFLAAKETFEGILMAKSVPSDIKAMALRQLGWLYHTNPDMAHPSENPLKKAIELLKLAAGADPTCGQTWYFLGRCHAAQGRAHDAFLAYQQAVNKSVDDQADTWCSIGVLYHNMCQPRDSLQSYLCAVYLDTDHLSAWTNMGCLYESVTQPVDALVCYKNAVSAKLKGELKHQLKDVKSAEFIHSRIMNLEQYIALMGPNIGNQPRSLPCVLEGWHALIPRHIKLRKPCPDIPMLQLPAAGLQNMSSSTLPSLPSFATLPLTSNGLSNNHLHSPAPKRPCTSRNKDPIILKSMNDSWLSGPSLAPPPSPLSPYPYSPMLAPNPGSMMSTGMGMTNPRLDGNFNPRLVPPMEPGQSSLGAGMGIGLSGMQDAVNRMGDLGVGPLMLKGQNPPSYPLGSEPSSYSSNPTTFSSLSGLHSSAASSPHFEQVGTLRDQEINRLITNFDDDVPKRLTNLDLLPQKWNFPSPTPTPHNLTTSNLNHLVDLRPSLISPALSSTGDQRTTMAPTLQTVSPTYSQMSDALSDHSTGNTPTTMPPTYPSDRSHLTSSTVFSVPPNHTLRVSVPPNPSSSASSVFYPSEGYSITLMNRQPYLPNFDKTNHCHPQPARKYSKPHFTGGFVNGRHVPQDLPMADLNSPPDSNYMSQIQRSHSSNHGNSHTSTQVSNQLPSPLAPVNRLPSHVPSDLPGDLCLVTPLAFGSEAPGMDDDYLQQYLDEGQEKRKEQGAEGLRQHSIPKEGLSPVGKRSGINSPLGKMNNRKFSESPKAFHGKWQKRSSVGSLEAVNASAPISPLHTLLSSPPSKENFHSLPNERISSHDIKKVNNTAMTSVHGVHNLAHSPKKRPDHLLQGAASTSNRKGVLGHSPAQHPMSPLQHQTHLAATTTSMSRSHTQDYLSESTIVVDTGVISDGCSSSGVSSASSKLSSSSDSSSPIDSSGIATSSPKVTSPEFPSQSKSHFNYPIPDSDTELEPGLLSPIHEPFPTLREEGEYMIQDPVLRPPDPPRHSRDIDLNPKVHIYEVESREDALSQRLHAFCTKPESHICMIRGMAPALGIDLNLFSTDALVATYADHEMEVREQIQQAADENWDPAGRRQVWKCESSKSLTTIKEYAIYQKKVLEEMEEDSTSGSDSDGGQKRKKKMLQFGTNVDLSDQDKWREQLRELDKLPKFLRVLCPEGNFLAHISYTILGMNSVQLYMKVPGSRTPGHQENNNCCSVNINIGPGNCEWFAVPNQYWGIIHNLCEKHKISFLVGSWWPILDELKEHNVPVYRFTQYMGDIVWINPGTVHWVQANSVCNNIAWNIGPLTPHQFRLSWERYQWNKIQKVRSIVPMIHLTWNFARRVKINNPTLYQQVRSLLESSLMQSHRLTAQLKSANVPVLWHGKAEGEPAPCCNNCLEEVFNILFVLNHKGEYRVYCHKCAGAIQKSFTVLQQYTTQELESVLASFKLHQPEST